MQNDTNPKAKAVAALTELFINNINEIQNFEELESTSIDIGHKCIAEALALTLETIDMRLLNTKPRDLKVHDIRSRTLATEIGDVTFSIRRYRDKFKNDTYLLADYLDIPYGTRISPGAAQFLIHGATNVSYSKAATLLARHGSSVKATTVMKCMRLAGRLCAEEDEAAALSLYRDGVIPDADEVANELCIEADGTYFRIQRPKKGEPKRLEVKALVAYKGKEIRGGKVRRRGCVHHALVGTPNELWSEGVASVGKKYDLSKINKVHLGSDGEKWCRDAYRYLPNADVVYHLDPFHINRAIMACFSDSKIAWSIINMINDGSKLVAISALELCLEYGLAREKVTPRVIEYLKGNVDFIDIEGPSLGTMESENQHLYGVRMDSFPCAWSIQGASDMARIISRRETKTAIPRLTRKQSAGKKRQERRYRRELSYYENIKGVHRMIKCKESDYLPPHQASTRQMSSGHAYALKRGLSQVDRKF